MKVRCVGMTVCDIALSPIPIDIMQKDLCLIDDIAYFLGGDATNVAVGLTKMGVEVSLSATIGNDKNGEFVKQKLQENHIDIGGVIEVEGRTTVTTFIIIDEIGERHFISCSGLFDELQARYITDEMLEGLDLIYLGSALTFPQMDRGGTADVFKRAHEKSILTAMDCCLVRQNLNKKEELLKFEEVLKYTDIFIPSIEEAKYLFDTDEVEDIAERVKAFGVKVFGVKLGSKGSFVTDYKSKYYFGIYTPEKIVDTTGAGDSFMAGFVRAYIAGENIEICGKVASAVASNNVECLGSTSGVKPYNEVKQYIDNHEIKIIKTTY